MNKKIKLLYPDSLYDLNAISCASFLYFEKGQIGITLHPTVSMMLTGCNPYDFIKYVEEKNPIWKENYYSIFNIWLGSQKRLNETSRLLKNMHELNIYKSILLAYPKTEDSLKKAEVIVNTIGLSYKELLKVINIEHAAQELMAHLHFEKILEIYGEPKEKITTEFIKRDVDYIHLYGYCNEFFKNNSIEEALVKSYFFRLIMVKDFDNFMLSNENLISLLGNLTQSEDAIVETPSDNDTKDVVCWELFRQLVSPYLDEKDEKIRISTTIDFLQMRNEEINRLKNKCLILAENFKNDLNLSSIKHIVSDYVAIHVEKDIQDLFALDKNAFKEIRDKLFSDEKTWFSLFTFITALYNGGALITAGAGLAGLSNIIAKTYETKTNINKTISKSDYALLYRIKKSY